MNIIQTLRGYFENMEKCISEIEQVTKNLKKSNLPKKKSNYSEVKEKLNIEVGKGYDDNLASLTHYFQVAESSISNYYKDEAEKYINSYKVKDNFQQYLLPLNWDIPFPPLEKPKFYFIDLFAGIGGFRIAFQNLGGKCVFTSEIDEQAKKSYEANFGEVPFGDITKINEKKIPEHDILLGGFPCQAFSIAGRREGFEDTRGTLFFDVARIIKEKKPKAFFLENVKGLVSHDKGQTLSLILKTLRDDLGYFVPEPKIINAKDFGVPQNRERIFIVGFRKDLGITNFEYPKPLNKKISFIDIREENPVSVKYYLSTQYYTTLINHKQRHESKGNGFGFNIVKDNEIANAIVVGGMGKERNLVIDDRLTDFVPVTKIKGEVNREGIRKMTPREWARLQGYPDQFKIVVADAQAYKQFGNSVAVPAIQATGEKIIDLILEKI